ncbi:FAD/NAD(P)-binding oxidoreductase [Streptomyces sp. NPDC050704]|uniref:NAD(P)/FAD-dependent oxidoreductase n=1 Tax=Streptomyces sp. NPDC050704 TaxID=3157219 RepID=UPI00343F185E
MSPRTVVVVGGSIAALTAAETLRLEGFDGSIVLLGDEDRPPYTRVPLSKEVLAGRRPVSDLALPAPSADVDVRLRTAATGLDVVARRIFTSHGEVPYDGLVIATGARARTIGAPEQKEHVLRSYQDGSRLRGDLATARSVLVVGGGFLGTEIASTCRELGKEVTLVDQNPVLERLLGPTLAGFVRSAAVRAGVRLITAPGGVRLLGTPTPSAVELADGRRLEADLVVSAAGDVPNVEWLTGSGVLLRGGVVVDERCRVRPEVVAAGDVAAFPTGNGASTRVPSWTNAIEQARAAARALLHGDRAPVYHRAQYFWTEQFGLDIKLAGSLPPLGPPVVLDGGLDQGSALLAWPDATAPRQIAAVNHATPPARLKRLVRGPHLARTA